MEDGSPGRPHQDGVIEYCIAHSANRSRIEGDRPVCQTVIPSPSLSSQKGIAAIVVIGDDIVIFPLSFLGPLWICPPSPLRHRHNTHFFLNRCAPPRAGRTWTKKYVLLTLSRLGMPLGCLLESIAQYFTSDLRTIVCIRTQCCPTQHARQSDSE